MGLNPTLSSFGHFLSAAENSTVEQRCAHVANASTAIKRFFTQSNFKAEMRSVANCSRKGVPLFIIPLGEMKRMINAGDHSRTCGQVG